jgi:hypothetical protein
MDGILMKMENQLNMRNLTNREKLELIGLYLLIMLEAILTISGLVYWLKIFGIIK